MGCLYCQGPVSEDGECADCFISQITERQLIDAIRAHRYFHNEAVIDKIKEILKVPIKNRPKTNDLSSKRNASNKASDVVYKKITKELLLHAQALKRMNLEIKTDDIAKELGVYYLTLKAYLKVDGEFSVMGGKIMNGIGSPGAATKERARKRREQKEREEEEENAKAT